MNIFSSSSSCSSRRPSFLPLLLSLLLLLPFYIDAFTSMRLRPAATTRGAVRLRAPLLTPSARHVLLGGTTKQHHHQTYLIMSSSPSSSSFPSPTTPRGGASTSNSNNNKRTKNLIAAAKSLYFPSYVLLAGLLGVVRPKTYAALSDQFVTRSLAAVMVLMGATLSVDDFKRIGKSKKAIALGFGAQFTIMPSMALLVSKLYRLPPHLAAGVVLVGCCPGGTASNLVTLLAEADVALSVTMTAVSTISASFMTPFLTSSILGSLVPVDTHALVTTTIQVVLLPVILGLLTNTFILPRLRPKVSQTLNRVTPVLSGVLVAAICGKVVASNSAAVMQGGLPLLFAVLTLHVFGFFFGFLVARALGFTRKVAKTVSIETGMQNSALACVLAGSLSHPLCALPGSISAVCHSVIGSMLAWVWSREKKEEEE